MHHIVHHKLDRLKLFSIIILIGIITLLHYSTPESQMYHHVVYRELYFMPMVLGGLWYGLRGGLITSLSITALYLPLVFFNWNNFSVQDLDKVLEIVFFNGIAFLVGMLRDREKTREKEKLEGVMAMAGTIAHELNTPLQVVLGNIQLLQGDFDPAGETYKELQHTVENIHNMDKTIKKITLLDQFKLDDYPGNAKIINIDKA